MRGIHGPLALQATHKSSHRLWSPCFLCPACTGLWGQLVCRQKLAAAFTCLPGQFYFAKIYKVSCAQRLPQGPK